MTLPTALVIISVGYGGYRVPSIQLLPSAEACIGLKDAIEKMLYPKWSGTPQMMCVPLGSEMP